MLYVYEELLGIAVAPMGVPCHSFVQGMPFMVEILDLVQCLRAGERMLCD